MASLTSQDFVLQEYFDLLRDWIINGGDNQFAFLVDRKQRGKGFYNDLPFPKDSHLVIISKVFPNTLVANISFYGSNFETGIFLSREFDQFFDISGLICDWNNRRELTLIEFITSLSSDEF